MRVRLVSTNSYVKSYQACEGSFFFFFFIFLRIIIWFGPGAMASRRAGPMGCGGRTYALDPAHRRDPDTMGDAAMCGVEGIPPPQQEKIDDDCTLFLG